MCQECGCEDVENKTIIVNKSLTETNDAIAHSLWHKLQEKEIFCVNILGAPGSGKTSVLEGISEYIPASEMAVIQGDLESDIDKQRLEKKSIKTHQINTHSACHLNAQLIKDALTNFDLSGKKYLFIENVGNLVCPAGVKIGQHLDIVVSATTEGSDKAKKYPIIFHNAKLALISKYDLAKTVEFDEEQYSKDVKEANEKIKLLKTSSKDIQSFKEIADYLSHEREHILGHAHKH